MLVFQKEKRAGNLANFNDLSGKTNKPLWLYLSSRSLILPPPPSSTKMMLFCAGFVWLLHPLCSYTYMCVFFGFYLSHLLLLLNETKSAFLFIHDFWQPCCTHSACQLCETGCKDFSCHYCSCVENQKLLDIIADFSCIVQGVYKQM